MGQKRCAAYRWLCCRLAPDWLRLRLRIPARSPRCSAAVRPVRQLLAGVDFGRQRLAFFGRSGDHQGAVAGDLIGCRLCRGVVVPILGAVRVDGQTVACGGQQHITSVIIQHIGAAGDKAHIGCAGGKGLSHGFIAGAHCDIHLAHVIAELGQFIGEHLLERFRGGDDFIRLA